MEFLVKVLSLQQMGAGYGGGFRTFTLPPHSCHIVSPVEDCALPYTKTSCDTFLVQDTACHLKVIACGAPRGVGLYDKVGNHICRKVVTPYNGVEGFWAWVGEFIAGLCLNLPWAQRWYQEA